MNSTNFVSRIREFFGMDEEKIRGIDSAKRDLKNEDLAYEKDHENVKEVIFNPNQDKVIRESGQDISAI